MESFLGESGIFHKKGENINKTFIFWICVEIEFVVSFDVSMVVRSFASNEAFMKNFDSKFFW